MVSLVGMSDRKRKKPDDLRSAKWFGQGPLSFARRSRTLQNGYALEEFVDRPVIGIINTWSDMNTCHAHLRERAQVVKRGVYQAGGFPVELPAMSLGEIMVKPTTMLYRNLLAMETEELIRSHPIDGVVLMGGCDKTTPALLMGAISMDVPAIYVPAGFMLNGLFEGRHVGISDAWKYGNELMAGRLTFDQWLDFEQTNARSVGTCNSIGTASTMTAIAEVLGFSFPGASSIPAVDARGSRMAAAAGRRIVEMVWEDLKPSDILSRDSFENAVTANLALGGSTNAAIHVLALARRAGIDVTLDDFDRLGREVPVVVNIQPSGKYLLEDYDRAGGLPALLGEISAKLRLDAPTITGKSLGQNIEGAKRIDEDVIKSVDSPHADVALAVLRGNLAPDGCVIKPSAASPELLRHAGPAVVFDSYDELNFKLHDESLDVTKDSVLVLRNCGPQGGPGMPEWGMLPIPRKLLAQGVDDMVRISDARMSGTSYGTCCLHVAPEAFVGGPLALVRTGDIVELDVEARSLNVRLDASELEKRRVAWTTPEPCYLRGYGALFANHVGQANTGCDFDFLARAGDNPEPPVYTN